MEYVTIGSVPSEAACVCVGTDDYEGPMRDECEVFKRMLKRVCPPPEGSSGALRIVRREHEFGPYFEVEAQFNAEDTVAAQWAYGLEANTPCHWDTIAAFELQWVIRWRAIEKAQQLPRSPRVAWPETGPGFSLAELLAMNPLPLAAALQPA
jgi:hypothetical protein